MIVHKYVLIRHGCEIYCFLLVEDYYSLPGVPFDSDRLKLQITSGQGIVYQSLLDVPTTELSKAIVVSDSIVETPNYLLAVSLGIPVYRHDLIINAYIQVLDTNFIFYIYINFI